jgi:hypothetical protein
MKTSAYLTILAILLACTAGLQAASTIEFTTTSYRVAEDAGAVTLTVRRLDDTNERVGNQEGDCGRGVSHSESREKRFTFLVYTWHIS